MYHSIVKHKLRTVFEELNSKRIDAIIAGFHVNASHYFIGAHALSGIRHTPDSIHEWYQRLLRLLPDIHFDITDIQVQGFPWSTLAVVTWRESNTGTDGVRTTNEGVNIIKIAWGRVVSIRIYTDTQILAHTLERLAGKGVQEALAPPIIS